MKLKFVKLSSSSHKSSLSSFSPSSFLFAFCSPFPSFPPFSPPFVPLLHSSYFLSFCLPSLPSQGTSSRPSLGVLSLAPFTGGGGWGPGHQPGPTAGSLAPGCGAAPRCVRSATRSPAAGRPPSPPGRAHRRPLLQPARGDEIAQPPTRAAAAAGERSDRQATRPPGDPLLLLLHCALQHGSARSGGRPRPLPPAAAAAPQRGSRPPRHRAAPATAAAARERVVPQPLPLLPHHGALHASDVGERPRRVSPNHHPVSSRAGAGSARPGRERGGGRAEEEGIPGVGGTLGGCGASALCLRQGWGVGPAAVSLTERPRARPPAAGGASR